MNFNTFFRFFKKHVTAVIIALVLTIFSLALGPYSDRADANEENQCIKCHTSAKMLINITREIAKANPQPETEASEGEG